MKKTLFPALFLLASLFCSLPLTALEFANFQARGYEGKSQGEFITPEDLLLGPNGDIVIADFKNNRVQIFNNKGTFSRFISLAPETPGVASYLATLETLNASDPNKVLPSVKHKVPEGKKNTKDDLPSIASGTISMDRPVGLALDANGRLLVSCSGSNQVLLFRYADGAFLGVLGHQGRGQGSFDIPMDIDVRSDGMIAIAELGSKRVQLFDAEGKFLREIYYKEETPKKELRALIPRGVLWLSTGELLVTYPTFHQVVAWDVNGNVLWRFGVQGSSKGELNEPSFLCQGPENHVLLTDTGNHRIVEISNRGLFVKNFPFGRGSSPGRLFKPRGLAFNSEESLYICDSGNNRFQICTPSQAAMVLKDARQLAAKDRWDEALPKIEQVLNMEPNDAEARGLVVNALHFFGNRAMEKEDFEKAEEYFRRIMIYAPNDGEVQKRLDTIFWQTNKDLILKVVFGIIGLVAALILLWVLKITLGRLIFGTS